MNKKITIFSFLVVLALNVFAFSSSALVRCEPPTVPQGDLCVIPSPSGGLTGSQTLTQLILRVVNILLGIAAAVAILFIIIGGFQFITSGANQELATKGRKTLTNALIGLAIIILSFAIVAVVNNTVSGGGFGFPGIF